MNLDSGFRGESGSADAGAPSSPPTAAPAAQGRARGQEGPSAPEAVSPDRGAELMARWQGGDDAAFDDLVREYSDHVFALLTRFLGRAHPGRDDLVQEVFLRVLRARERYEPTARFSTWLYAITWRICINETERKARRGTSSLEALGESAAGEGDGAQLADPDAPLPGDSMEHDDLVRAVRRAIADLPDQQRIAMVLSRYHHMSYAEIAAVVDSSEKAVKSLVHRARETLRQTLQPFMEEELA